MKIHNGSKKAIKDVLDAFKELTGISDLKEKGKSFFFIEKIEYMGV